MELWTHSAGAWTVEDFLRRLQCRMRVQQRLNPDLTEDQRAILAAEAERLTEPIGQIRDGQQTIEGFVDHEILEARETVSVRDAIIDAIQDETWKILGLRPHVIATAGLTREQVFDASTISEIKRASREVTAQRALAVAKNVRALPTFDERDRLSERLESNGQAMADELKALRTLETREAELRQALRRSIGSQRLALVASYGRLLSTFPKSFVESLFPRARNRPTSSPELDEGAMPPT